MKHFWLALFAISLSGCAGGANIAASYESLAPVGEADTAHEIDKRDLLVRIPAWAGETQQARLYREAGLVRQQIVIAGGTRGDHMIEATVAGRGANPAALSQPSDSEIESELATRFPGVRMHVIAPRQGEVGPDRVAIGRASDGTRCLYDWRWADDVRIASDPSGIGAVAAAFSPKATPALLRIRLCSKYVSLDDLASLARQIQFAPIADINRIIDGAPSNADAAKRVQVSAAGPTLESALSCWGGTALASERAQGGAPYAGKRLARRAPTLQSRPRDSEDARDSRFLAPPPAAEADKAVETSVSRVATGPRDLDLPAAAYRGPVAAAATAPSSGAQ
jgi:Cellulose biosynthesis protein BcsN